MRRMIYLMLASLSWMVGMAQSVELMRVYTDKDCYLAGEELWVKVCVDDDTFPGNDVSRVAYVEICDTAQIRAQGKIALTEGMGWACIKLPQTMHSGVYQLTAYTRYMRNLKHDCFPRKYIAVLNTLGTSEFDNIVKSDIDAVTEPVLDAVVYQMTNLLGEGNYGGALQKLQQLLKMQQEPLGILGAIGKHIRQVGVARTLADNGRNADDLMRLCGMKEYPAKKLMGTARKFSARFCAMAAELILETDRQMKTSYDDPDRLLEILILRLSQEARNG